MSGRDHVTDNKGDDDSKGVAAGNGTSAAMGRGLAGAATHLQSQASELGNGRDVSRLRAAVTKAARAQERRRRSFVPEDGAAAELAVSGHLSLKDIRELTEQLHTAEKHDAEIKALLASGHRKLSAAAKRTQVLAALGGTVTRTPSGVVPVKSTRCPPIWVWLYSAVGASASVGVILNAIYRQESEALGIDQLIDVLTFGVYGVLAELLVDTHQDRRLATKAMVMRNRGVVFFLLFVAAATFVMGEFWREVIRNATSGFVYASFFVATIRPIFQDGDIVDLHPGHHETDLEGVHKAEKARFHHQVVIYETAQRAAATQGLMKRNHMRFKLRRNSSNLTGEDACHEYVYLGVMAAVGCVLLALGETEWSETPVPADAGIMLLMAALAAVLQRRVTVSLQHTNDELFGIQVAIAKHKKRIKLKTFELTQFTSEAMVNTARLEKQLAESNCRASELEYQVKNDRLHQLAKRLNHAINLSYLLFSAIKPGVLWTSALAGFGLGWIYRMRYESYAHRTVADWALDAAKETMRETKQLKKAFDADVEASASGDAESKVESETAVVEEPKPVHCQKRGCSKREIGAIFTGYFLAVGVFVGSGSKRNPFLFAAHLSLITCALSAYFITGKAFDVARSQTPSIKRWCAQRWLYHWVYNLTPLQVAYPYFNDIFSNAKDCLEKDNEWVVSLDVMLNSIIGVFLGIALATPKERYGIASDTAGEITAGTFGARVENQIVGVLLAFIAWTAGNAFSLEDSSGCEMFSVRPPANMTI